ncbi:carbohydrate-binding family 9-like protein [Bradyrhizobium sp. dw_411]|uniref:carbohydrate-binding family 9-like protein n=1 Tax=Bradyrhizobium sp. dw_411 TaxID=2720082 RepID=UPI001BCAC37E|nr:carbohydrate-binding family 9-like protein [Bradyrhizobium sp. dw_411]
MKSLIVIAMLLTSANAFACDLSLVAPVKSVLRKPVQVKAVLADDMLTVNYAVTAPLNAKKILGPKQFPYMFDVVELFVTFSETGFPYFEFEVSPFNQTFQVRIPGGGKPFQEGVDLGLVSTATLAPGGWTAELKIPLKPLGWDGDPKKIRGNFYSILEHAQQSFWSSFLPKAKKPNFHQPQFFQPLLQCE